MVIAIAGFTMLTIPAAARRIPKPSLQTPDDLSS